MHSHYSLFKVAPEGVTFMVLNLPVLDWRGSQKLIQLDGVNSRCALFVLSGLRADPVVDVIAQRAAHLLSLEEKKMIPVLEKQSAEANTLFCASFRWAS